MAMLFRERGLQVTDEWVRSTAGQFPVAEVQSVWTQLPRSTRGRRFGTAVALVCLVLLLFGWAFASGWMSRNYVMLPAFALLLGLAAWGGALDPLAIWLEKRHHELWISTNSGPVRVWTNNLVEVNKAVRSIQRARERLRDAQER